MSDLYVYLMRSRNKDNKDIPGFKERCKTILEYKENEERILNEFDNFVSKGLLGEKTRLYRSVNSRNEQRIREELIIRLVRDKPSPANLSRVLASVSQKAECRDESRWLFDFDIDNEDLADEFINDIKNDPQFHLPAYIGVDLGIEKHRTPNGFAIIISHGFDTTKIMKKWSEYDITLKRDELLFLGMKENI